MYTYKNIDGQSNHTVTHSVTQGVYILFCFTMLLQLLKL